MPIERAAEPAARQFLDLDFSRLSFSEVVDEISRLSGRSSFCYVVTPNVDHIVKLHDEADDTTTRAFRAAYQAAAFRLCDSRILARMGRVFGVNLPVVTGSDLTASLFDGTIGAGQRVAIIGGRQDTVTRLKSLFPKPDIVQHIPPMGMLSDVAAMRKAEDFVCASRANFVLFATGAPQSEILAHRCAMRGEASGIGLCIGASIEFLLGDQRRAPRWMQRAGLEWFYRLVSSPKRLWRRYLVEGPKVFLIALKWWFACRRENARA